MRSKTKRRLVVLVAAGVLLLGYIAAGPFIAVDSIRGAIKAQNTAELARHVDFPMLRANLKAQFDDYLARRAGPDVQSSIFGAFGVRIASGVAAGSVDAMVTPAGLGAMLGGRTLWHRVSGAGMVDGDTYQHAPPPDPFEGATYGFESPARFTATVRNDDGEPMVFVLTRDGLRWKLSDVRLPLEPPGASPQPAR